MSGHPDGRVTEMDPKPEGVVRVFESALVSPLGPCEGIQRRMQAAGISAMLWRPTDNTGEALYVFNHALESARRWVQENLFG